jgi:hypothetical protein
MNRAAHVGDYEQDMRYSDNTSKDRHAAPLGDKSVIRRGVERDTGLDDGVGIGL